MMVKSAIPKGGDDANKIKDLEIIINFEVTNHLLNIN